MPIFLMNEWNRIGRDQPIIVCGPHLYPNFRIHRLLLFGLTSSCSSIYRRTAFMQVKTKIHSWGLNLD